MGSEMCIRDRTCTATGLTTPCRYNISCKSSNLIYCITCKTCNKQYVGQTKNSIATRFHSHFYIRHIRHKKQTDAVGLHFSQPNHKGTEDLKINVLEFIRLPPKSQVALNIRLKREKHRIHKLQCPAPIGLNLFDCTHTSMCLPSLFPTKSKFNGFSHSSCTLQIVSKPLVDSLAL